VWVVVDVYRMDSLLNAFGIHSNCHKTAVAGVVIGAEGFVSSSQRSITMREGTMD
jgi:hypothetical protein